MAYRGHPEPVIFDIQDTFFGDYSAVFGLGEQERLEEMGKTDRSGKGIFYV